MIFGDTTVYKGKRFEIKQNLIYKSDLTNKTLIFNTWTSMLTILQFSKESLELRGNHSSLEKYKRL